MSSTATLLTAEEYAQLPDEGRPTELIRGKVVTMNPPFPRHGQVCGNVYLILRTYVEKHDLGHVLSNDSGVITQHNPDTVRGADVAYYSYHNVPKGPMQTGYLPVAPELVFEVLSPDDRWSQVLAKVAEYLEAGVTVVCVLDPQKEQAHLHYSDRAAQSLGADDELTIPEVFDDFRVPIERFFA